MAYSMSVYYNLYNSVRISAFAYLAFALSYLLKLELGYRPLHLVLADGAWLALPGRGFLRKPFLFTVCPTEFKL